MSPLAIILLGCLAVLLFDLAGSLLVRRFPFDYSKLWPLSFLLYGTIAWFAADAAGTMIAGALAGAAAGATDATLGWRISRVLGVDQARGVTDGQEIVVTAIVTVTGAVIGGLAGLLA